MTPPNTPPRNPGADAPARRVWQPDPEKPDKVYGADLSGTLIALVPVTDETVCQTNLTIQDERLIKLDTNKNVLPAEGTEVRLIIEVK